VKSNEEAWARLTERLLENSIGQSIASTLPTGTKHSQALITNDKEKGNWYCEDARRTSVGEDLGNRLRQEGPKTIGGPLALVELVIRTKLESARPRESRRGDKTRWYDGKRKHAIETCGLPG